MSWQLAENHEISEVRKAYGQTLEQMILNGRPIMVCDADLAGSSGCTINIQSILLISASVKQI